ncbi:hypothetical protein GQ473_05170 [archaeon]|nr:hypothetical protein [archaeon]
MVDLNESEINHLKAVVGLSKEQSNGVSAPEIQKQDNFIPKEFVDSMPKTVNNTNESVKEISLEPLSTEDSAETDTDLFVKIDEHVQISSDLMDSKKEIKGVSDTVLLLAKAEKLKADAIERMESHLGKLDAIIQDVEIKLTAPESLKMSELGDVDVASGELVDLTHELNNLKDELSKMN